TRQRSTSPRPSTLILWNPAVWPPPTSLGAPRRSEGIRPPGFASHSLRADLTISWTTSGLRDPRSNLWTTRCLSTIYDNSNPPFGHSGLVLVIVSTTTDIRGNFSQHQRR